MASFKLMPGPRGLPLIGNALTYSKFGKHDFERLHLAKREYLGLYGTIYNERLGPGVNIVQVFDPEDIAKVFRADGRLPVRPPLPITIMAAKRDGLPLGLGSLNGEDWYQLRKSVQKLMMHPKAASVYLPAQNAVANDFLELLLGKIDKNGRIRDLEDIILRYTMESIGTVCFDTRLSCLGAQSNSDGGSYGIADQMVKATTNLFQAVQKTTFAFPWYALFRTQNYKQYVEAKTVSNRIALQSIFTAQNKCPAIDHTQTTPPVTSEDDSGSNFLQSLVNQETLTNQQIVGIVTDLFTAGIDSTANALCFVLYNLSKHTKAQHTLAEEIQRVCPPGEMVTQETFDNMPYMKACVKESFRVNFPIEGGTTRILQKNVVLGGYQVPKGTMVALNNQTMCLQSQYFSNPGRFLPERWLKGLKNPTDKVTSPYIMLPFGHGARMCIGRRFAEQEIYLAIIKIFRQFRVTYIGQDKVGMLNRVFTVPDCPLELTFETRLPQNTTLYHEVFTELDTKKIDVKTNITQ